MIEKLITNNVKIHRKREEKQKKNIFSKKEIKNKTKKQLELFIFLYILNQVDFRYKNKIGLNDFLFYLSYMPIKNCRRCTKT